MTTTTKILQASYMGDRFSITQKTTCSFMVKVRKTMRYIENNLMASIIHIDEFVLGDKESNKVGRSYNTNKKKAITEVQLKQNDNVKEIIQSRGFRKLNK